MKNMHNHLKQFYTILTGGAQYHQSSNSSRLVRLYSSPQCVWGLRRRVWWATIDSKGPTWRRPVQWWWHCWWESTYAFLSKWRCIETQRMASCWWIVLSSVIWIHGNIRTEWKCPFGRRFETNRFLSSIDHGWSTGTYGFGNQQVCRTAYWEDRSQARKPSAKMDRDYGARNEEIPGSNFLYGLSREIPNIWLLDYKSAVRRSRICQVLHMQQVHAAAAILALRGQWYSSGGRPRVKAS